MRSWLPPLPSILDYLYYSSACSTPLTVFPHTYQRERYHSGGADGLLDFLGRAGEDTAVEAELQPPESVRQRSAELHSLLSRLLVVDPAARPDAEEARRHPFLCGDAAAELPEGVATDSGAMDAHAAKVAAPSKENKGGLLARVRLLPRSKGNTRRVHPENASAGGRGARVVQ